MDLLDNHFEEIVTPMFKRGIEIGDITFEVHKQKEKYPQGIAGTLYNVGKNLQEKRGFQRTGITREIDERCFWNYQKGRLSVRLIPILEEEALPVMRISIIDPNPIEESSSGWFYGIDPRTKNPRIFRDFDMNDPSTLDEIIEIIERDY